MQGASCDNLAARRRNGCVALSKFYANFMHSICKSYARLLHSAPFRLVSHMEAQLKLLKTSECGSNSMVESQPSKLLVASSILVSRSIFSTT
jgi:hypothetical protein